MSKQGGDTGSIPGGLPDQEISYLKLLKTLRAAGQYGATELGVVRRIAAWIDSEHVLFYICLNQRWYDDWEVKEALLRNDHAPQDFRQELDKQVAIFDLLREMDDPALTEAEKAEIREDVRSLFQTLSEHDRGVVKQRAYELSSSRREGAAEPAPAPAPAPVPAPEAAARLPAQEIEEEAAPAEPPGASTGVTEVIRSFELGLVPGELDVEEPVVEIERQEAAAVEPAREVAEQIEGPLVEIEVPPPPAQQVPPAAIPPPAAESVTESPDLQRLDVGQRQQLAATTADHDLLRALAFEAAEAVQLALIANPALPEDVAALIARRAPARVAAEIYRNRRLFQRPRVQKALLESPNAPSAALLEVVNTVGDLSGLLRILSSPKIRFLEVKAKARSRLGTLFNSFSEGEKVAAVRQAGRPLLKELWRDFFRDESLVLRCLKEKQLDEGTVLEIARSKIAPRRALEQIANTPAWTGNYQVTLSLVLNPKTPRQVTTRLLRRLTPADRRMVRNNPMLPDFIRKQA